MRRTGWRRAARTAHVSRSEIPGPKLLAVHTATELRPEFRLNLQSHYDLEQEQERLANRLEKEVRVLAGA